ncbi:hypothetical protein [Nitrosospira sp. NRS527]|uniref:hypothetical protein n=1 Tax=Nitrosospira sp. NRS527 TaxID=155925 RepID=UPI001AF580FC|nr:hypothetical protein [Nitrosospira sp. NRS527]BCT67787.1 hypothetical protein NNRS527_01375 [Nitrosospira sp. NRS527]
MRSRIFFAVLVALALSACAHIDPHPMDMSSAVRSARTKADHNALAKHYEAAAEAMRARAQEQKNGLAEYREHGYYYGRQTEDLKEHTEALVRLYEEAAEANMSMAKVHREMAEEAR